MFFVINENLGKFSTKFLTVTFLILFFTKNTKNFQHQVDKIDWIPRVMLTLVYKKSLQFRLLK